tara:strand:+ start:585 stop:806 length:222 start_codon:yes stop_codon:yes gene_type:complete
MAQVSDPIVARFTFRPERAQEFLEDDQTVTQMEFDSIDEVISCTEDFRDALLDVVAIVNGQVVTLSECNDEKE